jgi:RIO kinase 1
MVEEQRISRDLALWREIHLAEWSLEKKLRLRQRRYEIEQLMREKRSEEMEVLEEVFDKSTLMIIYKMLNKGVFKKIFGTVKAGKEARIYWALNSGGRDIAVKVYLMSSSEFKKGRLLYIEGDPRFKHVRRDTRSLVYAWAQKEFRNLAQAIEAGVRVPRPKLVEGNVLVMEFIGKRGIPAPLLREVALRDPKSFYDRLIDLVKQLYSGADLVHGDLSEYNIMVWRGSPVIFDMSQAVPSGHPMAAQLLRRDLRRLNNYFRSVGVVVRDEKELEEWVTA